MHDDFWKRRSHVLIGFSTGLAVILSFAGCYKKHGEAVVLEKEHIAAREATPTPDAESSASPSESVVSLPASPSREETVREMGEDEVSVDGYVMKKDVRGTSKDPRAMNDERWIVRVKMIADLRLINVDTDQRHWDKVKVGDRIEVSYRQGKYTGTVWSADID